METVLGLDVGEVILTEPVQILPAVSIAALTETRIEPGAEVAPVAVSQLPPAVVLVVTVKEGVAVPAKTLTLCGAMAEAPPGGRLNVRDVGAMASVDGFETVRFTVTVCGLLEAPVEVTVIVPV